MTRNRLSNKSNTQTSLTFSNPRATVPALTTVKIMDAVTRQVGSAMRERRSRGSRKKQIGD